MLGVCFLMAFFCTCTCTFADCFLLLLYCLCCIGMKPLPKYTKPLNSSQRGNQGWTIEGRNRFAQLCRIVEEDRRIRGKQFDRLLAAHIVKTYGDKLGVGNKGRKRGNAEEEKEDFFDEMQFLSSKGEYCLDMATSVGAVVQTESVGEVGEEYECEAVGI